MRFILSVIGLAAVLWWTFVWRFDGKTPAQYAVTAWHSPTVQKQMLGMRKDLGKELSRDLKDVAEFPKLVREAIPKTWQESLQPQKPVAKNAPEPYSEEDRRSLDAVIDRAEKHHAKSRNN